jgi:hypothetical protein
MVDYDFDVPAPISEYRKTDKIHAYSDAFIAMESMPVGASKAFPNEGRKYGYNPIAVSVGKANKRWRDRTYIWKHEGETDTRIWRTK